MCVCECKNIIKQPIQSIILFVAELFANIERFSFYIKPSSGQYNVYSELYSIFKMKEKQGENIYAGHYWRSKDEFISDVFQWAPSHRCAIVGRPTWTYLQLFCADTRCSLEDQPEAMVDRDGWQERVWEIHNSSATWYIYIYIYI